MKPGAILTGPFALALIACGSTATEVEVPAGVDVAAPTSSADAAAAPRRPRRTRRNPVPPAPPHEPTAEDRARAEEAFERGRALAGAGNYREACDAFAESEAFEPSVGASFNLGDCHEKLGDTEAACHAYKSALDRARGQDARRELLEQRRAALRCTD